MTSEGIVIHLPGPLLAAADICWNSLGLSYGFEFVKTQFPGGIFGFLVRSLKCEQKGYFPYKRIVGSCVRASHILQSRNFYFQNPLLRKFSSFPKMMQNRLMC
jgi:hypothetical protein